MLQDAQASPADALRVRAEEGRRRAQGDGAAAWQRILDGLARMERPRELLAITFAPDAPVALGKVPTVQVASVDLVADPALAVGARRVLIAVPPGRLLSQRETAALEAVVAQRPAGSWALAVVGSEAMRSTEDVAGFGGLLGRIARLLGGGAEATWLLGDAAAVDGPIAERIDADRRAARAWLTATQDYAEVASADLALLHGLAAAFGLHEEASTAESGARHSDAEQEANKREAEARARADLLADLANLARSVEISIPTMALAFSASGLRERLATGAGGFFSEEAMRARLDGLWAENAGELRRRFTEGLAPMRTGLAAVLPPSPQPPAWREIPRTRSGSQSAGGSFRLYGGGAGATVGFLFGKGIGLLVGGVFGAFVAPLVVGAVLSAGGREAAKAEKAFVQVAEAWRNDAEFTLRRHLSELRQAVTRAAMETGAETALARQGASA